MLNFSTLTKLAIKPFAFELLDYIENNLLNKNHTLKDFQIIMNDLKEHSFTNKLCNQSFIDYKLSEEDLSINLSFENISSNELFHEVELVIYQNDYLDLQYEVKLLKTKNILINSGLIVYFNYYSDSISPTLFKNNNSIFVIASGTNENATHQIMLHQDNDGLFCIDIHNKKSLNYVFSDLKNYLLTLETLSKIDKNIVYSHFLENKKFTKEEIETFQLSHDISLDLMNFEFIDFKKFIFNDEQKKIRHTP